MMSTIKIFDTTLRDGEQAPGFSMNLAEKLKVAKQLEILGVDIIEAGFAVSSPGDFESVQAIANTVKNCKVASLSRMVKKDIDASFEALRNAAAPRIHTFIATSPLHMEYKLKMSAEQVLERIDEMVRYAVSLIPDVEFSAEDASRTPHDFLAKAVEAAIRAGACVVNIPDTVGYATPMEMFEMIDYLKKNVKDIDKVDISVHCHDDLGMSVANSLAAVRAGATQIECTINGIGERAGNAALEEIVMALHTRSQYYDATCNIDTTQLYRASRLLSTITGSAIPSNKAIVGKNAFAHESGIHQHGVLANRLTYEIMTPQSIGLPTNTMVLGKHSGKHAFEDRLKELGYKLSADELESSFNEFKALCDKKKEVTDSDIEALVEHKTSAVPEFYKLERFVVNSGNTINSTAIVKLVDAQSEIHEQVALGDGPVDAAYKAIEQIAGMPLALSDYRINSVSDGEDALGEVTVKVESQGRIVRGRGLSTDVIESSILAYINAINKLISMAK
ncbi:MAG: 2-isopropylmalate synthase [Eubacteriales bacterium]